MSEDGRVVFYEAAHGKSWYVYTVSPGGIHRRGPRFDSVGGTFALSSHGGQVAYVGRRGRQDHVVWKNRVGPAFDSINHLVVSPDGRRVAYVVEEGKKCSVVLDGKRGPTHRTIWKQGLRFSPDSQRMAYHAKTPRGWRMVMDSHLGKAFGDYPGPVSFSRDGKHFAYHANNQSVPSIVVLDGRVVARPRTHRVSMWLSPNGQRLVWRTHLLGDRITCGIVDYRMGRRPAIRRSLFPECGFQGPFLSADGRTLAYAALRKNIWRVYVNHRPGPAFDQIGDVIVLAPKGNRVVYAGQRGKLWHMVIDGRQGPGYAAVGTPAFSPDGRRVVYLAKRIPGQLTIHVDGRRYSLPGKLSDHSPIFSTDGHHWAAVVLDARERYRVVLDGRVLPAFGELDLEDHPLPRFDSRGRLSYLVHVPVAHRPGYHQLQRLQVIASRTPGADGGLK